MVVQETSGDRVEDKREDTTGNIDSDHSDDIIEKHVTENQNNIEKRNGTVNNIDRLLSGDLQNNSHNEEESLYDGESEVVDLSRYFIFYSFIFCYLLLLLNM